MVLNDHRQRVVRLGVKDTRKRSSILESNVKREGEANETKNRRQTHQLIAKKTRKDKNPKPAEVMDDYIFSSLSQCSFQGVPTFYIGRGTLRRFLCTQHILSVVLYPLQDSLLLKDLSHQHSLYLCFK